MISVENAINIITNEATQLKDEKISIDKCLGRITSINIYAKINNPPEHVSSMDGYALSLASLKSLNSLPIKIIGESAAGKPFNKTVKKKMTAIKDRIKRINASKIRESEIPILL